MFVLDQFTSITNWFNNMPDLLDVEKIPKVDLIYTESVFQPYQFTEPVIRCMQGWSLHYSYLLHV